MSEDEVLVRIMRRILAAHDFDMYVDIQTGVLAGCVIIDGVIDISLVEALVLRKVKG